MSYVEISDLPPSHPEFLPSQEIEDHEQATEKLLWARYEAECNRFRSLLFAKFGQYVELGNEPYWMLFRSTEQEGDGATLDRPQRSVLICLAPPRQGKASSLPMRTVQIYANEYIAADNDAFILTEEVVIDFENDSIFSLDFARVESGSTYEAARGLIFGFSEESGLGINHAPRKDMEPTVLYIDGNLPSRTSPFGKLYSIEDYIFNLDRALEIFSSVQNAEPQAFA